MSSESQAMANQPAVEVRNVSKAYRMYAKSTDRLKQIVRPNRMWYEEFHALSGIDLTVERGESMGVIGRNGAGKSTLLKILSGTLTPTSGEVIVRGKVAALLELGTGFNPEFTGEENVRLSASILGLTKDQIDDRYDDILAFADIGGFIHQPIRTYSSGMYARLAFAVAAHVDPDVLIVDEILSVGDIVFGQRCARFIDGYRDRGTLFFVTHDIDSVKRLCDRAIWLDHGAIRERGSSRDVTFRYLAELLGAPASAASSKEDAEAKPDEGPPPPTEDAPSSMIEGDLSKASAYGNGSATITAIRLEGAVPDGAAVLEGGEAVELVAEGIANVDIDSLIVGFFVRDRLGQNLFGTSTWATTSPGDRHVPAGSTFIVRYKFTVPHLPPAGYSITVAASNGSQESHTHLHWLDEALTFQVTPSRHVFGLIEIPIESTSMSVHNVDRSDSRPESTSIKYS